MVGCRLHHLGLACMVVELAEVDNHLAEVGPLVVVDNLVEVVGIAHLFVGILLPVAVAL